MSERIKGFVAVYGILCVVSIFLFAGLTYAVGGCPNPSPGTVVVDRPNSTDVLVSGQTFPIELTFNQGAARPSQYRLYIRCFPSGWSLQNIIKIANCDFLGACPSVYYWSVPLVSSSQVCQIGVQVLDNNFGVLDCDAGEQFNLVPSDPSLLSITPSNGVDTPGSPGGVIYTVSGGVLPYWTATLRNNQIDFSITRVNGASSPQKILKSSGPPYKFTVSNILSSPCADTTVIVGVQDSSTQKTRAYTKYTINCP